MAKKKAEVPAVEETVVENPENVVTAEETTNEEQVEKVAEQPVQENSEESAKTDEVKPEQKTATENDIPANIQRILKVFKNHPELYVSEAGRVFTPDAKPSVRGNAILYKNPFYNSKS